MITPDFDCWTPAEWQERFGKLRIAFVVISAAFVLWLFAHPSLLPSTSWPAK